MTFQKYVVTTIPTWANKEIEEARFNTFEEAKVYCEKSYNGNALNLYRYGYSHSDFYNADILEDVMLIDTYDNGKWA